MKTEIVEGWPQGHEIRILISETNASQVNAIRRALIADVPKLAITRVDFSQGVTQDNKGEVVESVNVLPDEVLAHRLAMIPIPTNLEEPLYAPDECPNCKDVIERDRGCPLCQVLYTLSARGPSADSEEEYKTVYAFAWASIVIFSFGIVMLYALLLFKERFAIMQSWLRCELSRQSMLLAEWYC